MPPTRRENATAHKERAARIYDHVCAASVERSMANLDAPLSAQASAAVLREVVAAADDPYGDGDQSPVPSPALRGKAASRAAQPLRTAWASGLDVHEAIEAPNAVFHLECFTGNAERVAARIEDARAADADGTALMQLLEARVSLLRLTPLHYCCHGARVMVSSVSGGPAPRFKEVVELLLAAGARPDSRELLGYTPLGMAAGLGANPDSLELVRPLIDAGANPNLRTRFGEGLLVPTIMSNNVPAFKALLAVGADVLLADNDGLTPRAMAGFVPALMQAMTEAQRNKIVSEMACSDCGEKGASKFCAICKKAYYCSKVCQRRHWKAGHKLACGKDNSSDDFLDIVIDTMVTHQPMHGLTLPEPLVFTNQITGVSSSKRMKPKDIGTAFVVKVNRPIVIESKMGAIKINTKNSDFLLIDDEGEGRAAHARLSDLIKTRGISVGKVYLSAKWLPPAQSGTAESGAAGSKVTKPSNVLRLDTSTPLPPPKPLW